METRPGRDTSADPAAADPVRARYFGDYVIIREIARGGMGVVFEARQVGLNRAVALKMILAGQLADVGDVKRFYTEAEAAAHLDHPGIVPIYEVGQHRGQHFFSMGFVEGQSLAQRLATGPLGSRAAADLFLQVAEAVDYAHRRGVIHRDIKPANILLDLRGRPRITDFGLAKRVERDSSLTASGQIMGTPNYMAPEQAAASKDITTSVDVYSIGAALYEALTGRPPFRGNSPLETLREVLERQPPPPRSLVPDVDRGLELICLKCLEKKPARRYASASELANDLRRWLQDEPLSVRPPGLREQAGRWLRWNARTTLLVVLIGVVWGMSTSIPLANWLGSSSRFVLVKNHQLWPDSLLTPLGWLKLAAEHPWLDQLALGMAVMITSLFGWLVAGALRPRTRLAAFGLAAACGLIASVASFLFIGPFEAVRFRSGELHPVSDDYGYEGDTFNLYIPSEGRRGRVVIRTSPWPTARREVEYLDVNYLSKFLPSEIRSRPREERDFYLGHLRHQAQHANKLQNVFTAVWTTMLSVIVFYVVLSLTSTAAATDPLASGLNPSARLGRYFEFYLPASLTVVCAVALFFLEANQHIDDARARSGWVSDWSLRMIPLVALGICAALARIGQSLGWSAGMRVTIELGWIIVVTEASVWMLGVWPPFDVGRLPMHP
jgi:serine/threonine protein kinase